MAERVIRIGTRGSKLAIWQALQAEKLVQRAWPEVDTEIVEIKTTGDRDQNTPLAEMGGVGVFVKELESALMDDRIDVAVHSAKDLPARMPDGLETAAVLPRGPVEDVILCREADRLRDLKEGALVGTSSPRRRTQLLAIREDLQFKPLRGNIDTRIRKMEEGRYDAIVMARAALVRLGMVEHITEILDPVAIIPSPGQGIVALQVRSSDDELFGKLHAERDINTSYEFHAERGFLYKLKAGCSAAVGGWARVRSNGLLTMRVRVLSPDGSTAVEAMASASTNADLFQFGKDMASNLLKNGAGLLFMNDDEEDFWGNA